jgi:hypothetical protein
MLLLLQRGSLLRLPLPLFLMLLTQRFGFLLGS